jgi:hypothetical protein
MNYKKYVSQKFWSNIFSVPVVWLPLPFFILLDLIISLYQSICFPIYNIPKVKRSEYILIMDRNKLQYLNSLEKMGCMYCGYANGLLLYLKQIAGLTESYWCGIMHENKPGFKVQTSQIEQNFVPFGNEKAFNKKYNPKK